MSFTPSFVPHGTVLGMFDLNLIAPQMNALKQVPVSVARILLKNGQDAIARASQIASAKSLPGQTARDKVAAALHVQATQLLLQTNPNAVYPDGGALKSAVTQAYIEANAADEGAAWIDGAWSQMWVDIKAALAALPAELRAAAASAVESITGVPIWAWAVGGVGLVALAGWFVYKLAGTSAGSAAANAYVGRLRK